MKGIEVPQHILGSLHCSICEKMLSRGPVFILMDGRGLCNACHLADPSRVAIRNTQYEALAHLALFPCRRQDEGCREPVSFTNPETHEEVCPHRQYVCPVGSANCDWTGRSVQFLEHCEEKHPDRVLTRPVVLTHDISTSNSCTYLLQAFNDLFLLFTKVCVSSGKIFYFIRYLGSSIDAQNFKYKVQMSRKGERIIKCGQVVPQGCLEFQEDASVIININYLLGMFGGFDECLFKVILIGGEENCYKCDSLLKVHNYRDAEGWICKKCAPSKLYCKNITLGCAHRAFPNKLKKHEEFFCKFAKYCLSCDTTINDQFINHCEKDHMIINSGNSCRITMTGHACYTNYLLLSDAGKCAFRHFWTDFHFEIYICSPLSNSELNNFECTVKVTQVATDITHIYKPNLSHSEKYDWFVIVTKNDFPNWTDTFDMQVSLIKNKNC